MIKIKFNDLFNSLYYSHDADISINEQRFFRMEQ